MRTGTLADDCPMAVERALPEAEKPLFILEPVERQTKLGVLDAHVCVAGGHLGKMGVVILVHGGIDGE